MTLTCIDAEGSVAHYKACFTTRHKALVFIYAKSLKNSINKFLLKTEFLTIGEVMLVLIPLSLAFQFLFAIILASGTVTLKFKVEIL